MNCVGFGNHKHFILLLAYGLLTSVVGLCTVLPELLVFMTALEDVVCGRRAWDVEAMPVIDAVLLVAFGVLAAAASAMFMPMLLFHVPLATINQTKIENYYDNMPNPYDLRSSVLNIATLFGKLGPDWLLPVPPCRPVTDGVSFARGDVHLAGAAGETAPSVGGPGEAELLWRLRYYRPAGGPPGGSSEDPWPSCMSVMT